MPLIFKIISVHVFIFDFGSFSPLYLVRQGEITENSMYNPLSTAGISDIADLYSYLINN